MIEFFGSYFFILFATAAVILAGVAFVQVLAGKKVRWRRFEFSVPRYHLLLLPLLAPLVVWLILFQDLKPLYFFAVFALAGVIGEILFSFYWDLLIDKRFWVYTVDTFTSKGYSSWLNFIPWGVGGLLYINTADAIGYSPETIVLLTFWTTALTVAGLLFVLRSVSVALNSQVYNIEFRTLNITTYFIVTSPFIAGLLFAGYFHWSMEILIAAFVLALVALVVEYLFGKACEQFLSRRLWTYTYASYDRGHVTLLSILPFSFAGFYFLTIHQIALLLL